MGTRTLIEAPVGVRWGDMDAFGHVNNATFATYVEEARLRWFASLGDAWQQAESGPVVAAQHINYRLPIAWPAELVVTLATERVGNSSLTLGFRIVDRAHPQRTHADGTTVLVWMDRRSGRSVALPAAVRAAAAPA